MPAETPVVTSSTSTPQNPEYPAYHVHDVLLRIGDGVMRAWPGPPASE
jgi:hypothetical protein